MKIEIQDKVFKFLEKKNKNSLSIRVKGCSSWGIGEPQPVVELGEPKEDNFTLYKEGNIDVYVENSVKAKDDTIKLKVTKILFKEILVVENLDI